jgi:hypothetical protein
VKKEDLDLAPCPTCRKRHWPFCGPVAGHDYPENDCRDWWQGFGFVVELRGGQLLELNVPAPERPVIKGMQTT